MFSSVKFLALIVNKLPIQGRGGREEGEGKGEGERGRGERGSAGEASHN
jgi:hypothetical protein